MNDAPFARIDEPRLRGGGGLKWAAVPPGVIPAWIADMDLGVPPAVRARLQEALDREDLGYPSYLTGVDPVVPAFEARMATRFGWTPHPGRTRVFADLIQVLQVVVEHTTAPGDAVALHVPSYPPFLASLHRAGRRIVPIPMLSRDGAWTFDRETLADDLRAQGVRLLVVVNPHNPTGRVLRRDELEVLADVARELDLTVLSDEIHADLAYEPHRHVPLASLGEDAAARTVTATSATKAFNIAGLRCCVAHVGPEALRRDLDALPPDYFGAPSSLGQLATVAAWEESEDWRVELVAHLRRNRDAIAEWAATSGVGIELLPPEATYLAWLDVSGSRLGGTVPASTLLEEGRVKLNGGWEFSAHTGVDTRGFVRLNFATSEDNLREILARIEKVARATE